MAIKISTGMPGTTRRPPGLDQENNLLHDQRQDLAGRRTVPGRPQHQHAIVKHVLPNTSVSCR